MPQTTAVIKKLIHYRRLKALSQRELAKLAELNETTVIAAEHGKPVSMRTVRKLSDALDVSTQELLQGPARKRRKSETQA